MLITDPDDKLYFHCEACDNREFDKIELFEFKYSDKLKEYVRIKSKEYYRCSRCGKAYTKEQVK